MVVFLIFKINKRIDKRYLILYNKLVTFKKGGKK